MKRTTFVSMVALLLVAAANVWAGEEPAKEKPGQAGATPVPRAGSEGNEGGLGRSSPTWYIDNLDKMVQLTDEQKKTITSILEARDKAMKDFNAANGEKLKAASTAMMELYKNKNPDKDALAKAQKEYQELYAPMQEVMKKSQDELDKVLTAEQKAKQRDARTLAMLKNLTAPAELSEEQIKKFRAAYDQPGAVEGFGGKLQAAIDEILTPEQKVVIARHRLVNYAKAVFTPAKLTEEQSKQVAVICDEIAKDPMLKGAESYKKLTDKANALLTDEQKEAMKKVQMAWGQAGGATGLAPLGAPQLNPAPGANPNPSVKKPEEKKPDEKK